ncbi:MAG TPA: lysylphosphatidylglycerol synthase transmembrane domain-containing protein [Methanothrix sp.]|nr:lysylphosphatidylglycerol synthase transmembrane domain-containing protein [Methanothrix sp.]HPJ84003.1 lysylphosphatidylglycerol synthase transmembrane domain-containing protein [Methanothrix sp.]HPR65535.1 lysylphosphatidylglycerol synthase transmembrane domain-containing protein [Methanothrix sp.]
MIPPKNLARLLVGLLLITAMLYRFDANEILVNIRSAKLGYLALGVLAYSLTFLVLTVRWRMILSAIGVRLPLIEAYQAFAGGVLLSDFTPARIGDLSRPLMVKDRVDLKKGVLSVVIDRYADILTIGLLGTSGLLLFSDLFGFHLVFATLLFLAVILSVSLFLLKRSLAIKGVEWLGCKRLSQAALRLDAALGSLDHLWWLMIKSVLLTVIAWLLHALRLVLIARSVGYDVPLYILFFLQPLVSALSLIPITVSGLGLVEGGIAALLFQFDVPLATGISIALLDRATTTAFHLLVGGRCATKIL